MKKTFYVGENKKHKIDVNFGLTGKEQVYVDDIIVHERISLSTRGKIEFKAGDHDILIDMAIRLKEWSCKVFVDDALYIQELFDEELNKHKKRLGGSRNFYKYLFVACIIVFIVTFFKSLYQGWTG